MTKTFLKRFGSWFGGWDDTKERSDEKRLFYIHVNQEKVLKISPKAKKTRSNKVKKGQFGVELERYKNGTTVVTLENLNSSESMIHRTMIHRIFE